MVVGGQSVGKQVIEIGIEAASGHLGRVLQLERAGGGIARVGEQGLLVEGPLLVQPVERLPWQYDLASYLKAVGPVARPEHQRYAAYGLDVFGHVVTLLAVAAGHGPDEASVLVGQRDACAVKLHLAHDGHEKQSAGISEGLVAASGPLVDLLYRICVAQRQHGARMRHLHEPLGKVRAYAMRGRQRVVKLGICLFKPLELFHQGIILAV